MDAGGLRGIQVAGEGSPYCGHYLDCESRPTCCNYRRMYCGIQGKMAALRPYHHIHSKYSRGYRSSIGIHVSMGGIDRAPRLTVGLKK